MSDRTPQVKIQECYRRAQEARRFVDTARTPAEKTDFVEVERRWLSLADEVRSHLSPTAVSAAA
jgi:hypothetical protein